MTARPPASGTAVRRRPANRKAEIVETARRLAAVDGPASVSMEDIATAVGITAGALYRHFSGREALFQAVRADTVERFVTVAETARRDAPGDDRSAAIGAITSATVSLALDDPTLMRVRNRRSNPSSDSDRRLMKTWSDALVAAAPGISRADARLRQDAVAGALAESTWRPGAVSRPRLDDLLIESCTAVLLTPTKGAEDQEPARPRAKGWRPPASRQDEILAAALGLFRAKGFAGTTMDDIGRAVGLAASGIYRTYDQKADILLDAYDRVAARVEVGTEAALSDASGPADALRRLALAYCEVALDNPDLIIVTEREARGLSKDARRQIGRRNRSVRDPWIAVLKESRPDLAEPEAGLLYRGALSLANQVALSVDAERERLHGSPTLIAGLMLPFLTPNRTDPTPRAAPTRQGETT